MSGRVYQFGSVMLPIYESQQFPGQWNIPAQAKTLFVNTLGGMYDASGADQAEIQLPFQVVVSAIAYETTAAALGARLDSYRAMLGKRGRLWLDPYDTTQVDRFCWARLADISYPGESKNRLTQPMTWTFQALTGWQGHSYGGAWNLDSGYLFDSGLYFDGTDATTLDGNDDIALVNAGNCTCTNCGITLTAGSAPVTTLTVSVASLVQWTWMGTLAAGKSLVIDCGSRTVLNDGADAYSGFALGANHYTPYWLPLVSGTTTVNVVVDGLSEFGTNPTIQFSYADTWV